MAAKFKFGETLVNIQNPIRGNAFTRRKAYATGRTAAGKFYRYSKGIEIQLVRLSFENLRDGEKSAFEAFFFDTIDGPGAEFDYTDHLGKEYRARFMQDTLDFIESDDDTKQKTQFESDSHTYPTSIRKNPVWSVSVEMEIWPQ